MNLSHPNEKSFVLHQTSHRCHPMDQEVTEILTQISAQTCSVTYVSYNRGEMLENAKQIMLPR